MTGRKAPVTSFESKLRRSPLALAFFPRKTDKEIEKERGEIERGEGGRERERERRGERERERERVSCGANARGLKGRCEVK